MEKALFGRASEFWRVYMSMYKSLQKVSISQL